MSLIFERITERQVFEIQPDGTLVQVDDPPKTSDMVSVIRCRDCKSYKTGDAGSYCCKSITILDDPSGFCAWAEVRM